MKSDIKQNGMWWSWVENCDKCGKLIQSHLSQSSRKPNTEEVDFCAECLRYFIDNNIPYETAKKQYKRNILSGGKQYGLYL